MVGGGVWIDELVDERMLVGEESNSEGAAGRCKSSAEQEEVERVVPVQGDG